MAPAGSAGARAAPSARAGRWAQSAPRRPGCVGRLAWPVALAPARGSWRSWALRRRPGRAIRARRRRAARRPSRRCRASRSRSPVGVGVGARGRVSGGWPRSLARIRLPTYSSAEREQQREEDAPLDADGRGDPLGALQARLVEQPIEDQQRHPAAGEHHDRAVAAGQVEIAPLAAREQQREHAGADEQHGRLDERERLKGAEARLAGLGGVVFDERVGLGVPGKQHRHEQPERRQCGQPLLALKLPPSGRQAADRAPALRQRRL